MGGNADANIKAKMVNKKPSFLARFFYLCFLSVKGSSGYETLGVTSTVFFITFRPSNRILRVLRNETMPAHLAKRVWSLPTLTFFPGVIFVPR